MFFKDRSILLQEILQRNLGFDIRFCLISWIGCLNHLDVQKRVNWKNGRNGCKIFQKNGVFHVSFLVRKGLPFQSVMSFAAVQVSGCMIFSETARGRRINSGVYNLQNYSRYDICFGLFAIFPRNIFGNFENISPDYQFASCLPYWTFRSVQES